MYLLNHTYIPESSIRIPAWLLVDGLVDSLAGHRRPTATCVRTNQRRPPIPLHTHRLHRPFSVHGHESR
jgi:hypothetical protein